MLVSEVIELAQHAELQQLAIKDNKPAIIGFINLGILELHKRFTLVQKEAVITMVDDKYAYKLNGEDADVTIDLSVHNLLKVDAVFDYDGIELAINDENDADSVATPEYDIIELPTTVLTPTQTISVIYRAAPKSLTHEKAKVPLPPQFLEALLHYVGYRGHSSLRGDKEFENNTHYMRFDKSCNLIKWEGLFTQDSLNTDKFEARGFV